jgi:hypothetical protein
MAAFGCGATDDVVIRVDGNPISRATVDHWLEIQEIISGDLPPRPLAPAESAPNRLKYRACVSYLKKTEAIAGGNEVRTVVSLQHECRERGEAARRQVLAILITYQWLLGESKERHITVSSQDVAEQVAKFRHSFPNQAAFSDYLKHQGKDVADQALILEIDLLQSNLKQAIIEQDGVAEAQRVLQKLPEKWAAKTSCAAGYVVPNCKQYKGSDAPEITT